MHVPAHAAWASSMWLPASALTSMHCRRSNPQLPKQRGGNGGNVNTLYCLGRMLVTDKTNTMSFRWLRKHLIPCVCAGLPSAQISVGVIEERAAAKGK